MALGSNAPRCAAGDCPEQLRFDVHQLHHEGLLMVGRVLIVNPERLCGDAAHCKAMRRSEKQGFAASVSCLLSPRRASRHEAKF